MAATRNTLCATLALAAAASACRSDEVTAPEAGGPVYVIEDGRHGDPAQRNDHFFWLPPVVPAPSPAPSGAPDAMLLPAVRVEICDLGTSRPSGSSCQGKPIIAALTSAGATYVAAAGTTTTTSPAELVRYDPVGGFYHANWRTDKTPLLTTHFYRLRVLVVAGGRSFELGQADVDVLKNAGDLKNYDTGNSIPLVDGRTLPVKFRIEVGAANVVSANGGSTTVSDTKGGTVVTADGALALVVPAGALPQPDLTISVASVPLNDVPSAATLVPGTVFDLGPEGTTFDNPVTLDIGYDPAALPTGLSEGRLRLFTVLGDRWSLLPQSESDPAARRVVGATTHFSKYGVLGIPSVATGAFFACVLRTNGTVFCWGGGEFGQGREMTFPTPHPIKEVIGQVYSFCALDTKGDAFCWGHNNYGQLGIGHATVSEDDHTQWEEPDPKAVVMPQGESFNSIAVNYDASCATSTAGKVYCWGGGLGLGMSAGDLCGGEYCPAPTRVPLPTNLKFIRITMGVHTCALTDTGVAYCWGWNGYGQLARHPITPPWDFVAPGPVNAPGLVFTSITAGFKHTCAVATDGHAYCWGSDASVGNPGASLWTIAWRPSRTTRCTAIASRRRFGSRSPGACRSPAPFRQDPLTLARSPPTRRPTAGARIGKPVFWGTARGTGRRRR